MLIKGYNLKKIGMRLKEERKAAGFSSQDALSEFIEKVCHRSFKRQTIAKWERGEDMPPLEVMLKLCERYDCELGYLLCEHDTKIKTTVEISAETGLSEEAINHLRELKKTFPKHINSLNFLLTSNNFDNVLYYIDTYSKSVKLCYGLLEILNTQKQIYYSQQQTGNSDNCNYPHTLQERYTSSEKDMDIEEYKLDTNFRYIIQELRNKNKP